MTEPPLHVMFDADGVLQSPRPGWIDRADRYVGDRAAEFMQAAFIAERPTLIGGADFVPLLGEVLQEFGSDADPQEVFNDLWLDIVVSDASLKLVRRLRNAGHPVHLGTNQNRQRAAYMKRELGYDAEFDVAIYSCDLGVPKPDPAYFRAAAQRIGAPPARVVFVDDRASNTDGAERAGMLSVTWTIGDGIPSLVAALGALGIAV